MCHLKDATWLPYSTGTDVWRQQTCRQWRTLWLWAYCERRRSGGSLYIAMWRRRSFPALTNHYGHCWNFFTVSYGALSWTMGYRASISSRGTAAFHPHLFRALFATHTHRALMRLKTEGRHQPGRVCTCPHSLGEKIRLKWRHTCGRSLQKGQKSF